MKKIKIKSKKKIQDEFQSALDYHRMGKLQQAESLYRKILEDHPNNAHVYNNLGSVLQQKEHLDEAIDLYKKSLNINPQFAQAYYNLGSAYHCKKQLDNAILCYQKALHLQPNHFTYNNLGSALKEKGNFENAISCYYKAIQIDPNYANAYINLANIYTEQGKLTKAEEYCRRAIQIKPHWAPFYSSLIATMIYNSANTSQVILLEHLNFAKKYTEPLIFYSYHVNERNPNRRIRIGYLSPDFRRHSVAYFFEPVLISHDKQSFEVFCYSNNLQHDEVTKRIQEHTDQWRNITKMSDEGVTKLIRKDKIDILIDLAGHTANNRILVFAKTPAPIQISWIGYLATTGLATMHYRFTDMYLDPPRKTEQYYTEELIRLPDSFLCYLPDKDSPDVRPLPVLSIGHITFGSLNNFAKVSPEVIRVWTGILQKLPDSRLLLKAKCFHDKSTCQYAINLFTQTGVEKERITLQSFDPSPKHLESYNQIDIGLDTFPFNGGTTTCEALWMGIPVITLEGTAYNSGVGVSLLTNAGLSELIAKTPEEYITLAINLAHNIEKLNFYRNNLRDMMMRSPLTDSKRFTDNLEKCYKKIWKDWCQST